MDFDNKRTVMPFEMIEDCQLMRIDLWQVAREIRRSGYFDEIIEKAQFENCYFPFPICLLENRPYSQDELCWVDFVREPKGGYKIWLTCQHCKKHRRYLFLNERERQCWCRECLNLKYRSNYKRYNILSLYNDVERLSSKDKQISKRRLVYGGKLTRHGKAYYKNKAANPVFVRNALLDLSEKANKMKPYSKHLPNIKI